MENGITIWGYIDRKISSLKAENRIGTARNYGKTRFRLWTYCKDANLGFDGITEEFVTGFNVFLERTNVQKSTISFYHRTLRSIYNQAAKEGLVKNCHPFDSVYTKVEVKLNPINTVRTEDGEVMELEELSREELMRRCRILQHRYNKLVTRITNLARV